MMRHRRAGRLPIVLHRLLLTVLVLASTACAEDGVAPIVVIRNRRQGPAFRRACERCLDVDIGEVAKRDWGPVRYIIISGDSLPPDQMLGVAIPELAAAISRISLNPRVLVMDTCFGANAEFLLALDEAGVHPDVIVAAARKLPIEGLDYSAQFFSPAADLISIETDVTCCSQRGTLPLSFFRAGYVERVRALRDAVRVAARSCRLDGRLVHRLPNLVAIDASAEAMSGVESVRGRVIVHLDPKDWCPEQCAPVR